MTIRFSKIIVQVLFTETSIVISDIVATWNDRIAKWKLIFIALRRIYTIKFNDPLKISSNKVTLD